MGNLSKSLENLYSSRGDVKISAKHEESAKSEVTSSKRPKKIIKVEKKQIDQRPRFAERM